MKKCSETARTSSANQVLEHRVFAFAPVGQRGGRDFGFAHPVGEKLVWPLQPHLFDARFQHCGFDSEQFRRAVLALDFPMRLLKDGQQVAALAALEFRFREKFRLGIALGVRGRS